MLLGGAHDSRAGPPAGTRPRRAVRGSSGPLCRAWGSLFCKACLQTPWPVARAVEGGSAHRFVVTRTDSLAYGYCHLLIFAEPAQLSKSRRHRSKLPA